MLHVGVFLKKTKSIFGVFLINFQKIPFFHRYIGQITCQHSILWCVFFGNLEIQFQGKVLLEKVSEKISSIVETVSLEIFIGKTIIFYGVISNFFFQLKLLGWGTTMNQPKSSIFDRCNPMNFLQKQPKMKRFGQG